jgi:hypothetical protein
MRLRLQIRRSPTLETRGLGCAGNSLEEDEESRLTEVEESGAYLA